ncbi:MAG: hypothetical protein K0R28_6946, partial [Paenibacillus sp.]|nr:hypothetical protein [Paenibacillus sp.]
MIEHNSLSTFGLFQSYNRQIVDDLIEAAEAAGFPQYRSGEGRSSDKEIETSLSSYNTFPVSKSVFEARVKEMSKDGQFKEAD